MKKDKFKSSTKPKVESKPLPTKPISRKTVDVIKTKSPLLPTIGRVTKLLNAEKALLEGRLAEVNNLLIQLEATPGLDKIVDIMLNQFTAE